MLKLSDELCVHCKILNPHGGENIGRKITVAYDRVDQYPDFLVLEAYAREGCALRGLLGCALQNKYSDQDIAQAENQFSSSIRAKGPLGWNGRVTIDRIVFSTEEDWPERDRDQILDQSRQRSHLVPQKLAIPYKTQ